MKLLSNIQKYIIEEGNKIALQNNTFCTYQVSRSLIAFATLCTLLFSPTSSLFTHKFFITMEFNNTFLNKLNLFSLLGYERICKFRAC